MTILSQFLQKYSATIPSSYQAITKSVRAIEKFKEMPGACMKEAEISKGCFRKVARAPRRESSRVTTQINKKQLCQSLCDNLKHRLLPDDNEDFKSLMKEIDILDNKKWSYNIRSPWSLGKKLKRCVTDFFTPFQELGMASDTT